MAEAEECPANLVCPRSTWFSVMQIFITWIFEAANVDPMTALCKNYQESLISAIFTL